MPHGVDPTIIAKHLENLEDDPVLALGVLRLRFMMEHRRITNKDIAEFLDVTVSMVRKITNGSFSQIGPASRQAWVERLEDAITGITDSRGGIPEACCGLKGYIGMREVLSLSHTYEEV